MIIIMRTGNRVSGRTALALNYNLLRRSTVLAAACLTMPTLNNHDVEAKIKRKIWKKNLQVTEKMR